MALAEDVARLVKVPLLGVMEPEALRLLAFACESRILLAETVLFAAGTRSSAGFLVISGGFRVDGGSGPAPVDCGPGSFLAETALLREAVHDRTATATDTSTVLKIPRTAMLRVLEEHPASARRVLAFYAGRLRQALGATETVKDQASP